MPSINHYVEIHAQRRIRINTCEGDVSITDETKDAGKWSSGTPVRLTRKQAQAVADMIVGAMAKHY